MSPPLATFVEAVAAEFFGDVDETPLAVKFAGDLCRYMQVGMLLVSESVERHARQLAGRMPFDPPTSPAEAKLIRTAVSELADHEPYLLMIQRHLRLIPAEDHDLVRLGLSLLIVKAQLHRLNTGRKAAQL